VPWRSSGRYRYALSDPGRAGGEFSPCLGSRIANMNFPLWASVTLIGTRANDSFRGGFHQYRFERQSWSDSGHRTTATVGLLLASLSAKAFLYPQQDTIWISACDLVWREFRVVGWIGEACNFTVSTHLQVTRSSNTQIC